MSSRAEIMARVQRAAGRHETRAITPDVPARLVAGTDDAAVVQQFRALAAATQMSVEQVASLADVPAAVCAYLDNQKWTHRIVVDAQLAIDAAHWNAARLDWDCGDTMPDGDVYVREGFAAIAACGAIVLASGAGRALRNDFLAQTHIVVVPRNRLLPDFSGLWALLRQQQAAGLIAREICLVTGPSRTADLGVPAKLGAHGPARVHVLVVG